MPWIEATRPKTLAASVVPVLIGTALAYHNGKFGLDLFLVTLLCSILIQIITNFANEVYDFKKGADKDRIGPKRQVASGIISVKLMMNVSIIISILTFILGLYLVFNSSFIILIVGILSLIFSFLYTGGPYPLAYNALGDLFVFVFFGIIAVNGTYYVQTGEFSIFSFMVSIPPGLLSANILNVNNIRDIDTDYKVGKITLSYKIGKRNSIFLFQFSTLISYIVLIPIFLFTDNYWTLLPLLSLPLSIILMIEITKKTKNELNSILAQTAGLLFFYGILSAISFILIK